MCCYEGPPGRVGSFLASVGPEGAGAFPAGRGRRHTAVQGAEAPRDPLGWQGCG